VTLLAPFALMALMWFLSSQPDLSSDLGVIDLVGRKVIHALSFGLLCLLWWRALHVATPNRSTAVLAIAVALSVAYAAVDEYHQSFVPGRNGSPVDVAIDFAGACAVALLIGRRVGGSR
jgi:VanZ family protein